MSALRIAALEQWEAWQKLGILYQWCGKLQGAFPDVRWAYGADCSGFVTGGLYVATRGRVDWRTTHNADRLHKELPCTATPKPGDLAVYGTPEKANHVMVWVGDGRVLGACGGGPNTTSRELAMSQGARVRYRNRADYRQRLAANGMRVSDFLGYRVSPLDEGAGCVVGLLMVLIEEMGP